MSMKKMKTLTINDTVYEVVDDYAREYFDNMYKDNTYDENITSLKYVYSPWEGRKFIAFGTSITRMCDNYAGGYLEVVKNRLGFDLYTNNGISGASLISNGTQGKDNILNCIKNTDLSNYDLITIECGTNDFKLNVPLGAVGIMGDTNFDTTTFCGALRTAIEHILTSYQMKHIVLIASPQRYDGNYDVNYKNSAGYKHIDYVNAIVEIGELYSITVIDLYRKSMLNALTTARYTYDGIHPNSMGYMMIGNQCASEIGLMACVFNGLNEIWTDTILNLDGNMYDISVSARYKYKMVMNLNDTLYLYFDNEPLKVHKDAYRECFYSDCYRAKNVNGVFGEVTNIIDGVNQTELTDGYIKMNKDRQLSNYVISNHDLLYWGTDEVAIYSSENKDELILWDENILYIYGLTYDISFAKEYEYKMILKIGNIYYLYYGNEPFYIKSEISDTTGKLEYYECWCPDSYRAVNNNGVFTDSSIISVNESLHAYLGDGYYQMNRARKFDDFVSANHNVLFWGTNEIAISESSYTK